MNIRAAIIHIIGDIVQSIGVVIASIIVYFKPEWRIADPICTFIFTILCMLTTIPIFRDCCYVLMESTPKNIDVIECFNELVSLDCVEEIHDFHVWSLSVGKLAMSGHIRSSDPEKAMEVVSTILREKYEIFHTTVQVEKSSNGVAICCDNDKSGGSH
jgi:solute carrier family 30 (zinc transporter), member 2